MPPLISAILREMRPKQWTKNVLLFAGLFFAHHLNEPRRVMLALAGFVIFCGLSSVIYIYNDLRDVASDREHPLKRKRPIASGELPIATAWTVGALLAAASVAGAFLLNTRFGLVATGYFVVMLAYSAVLKHMVIIDLLIVALGFVIRAIAGVLAIEYAGESIPITPWFLTCVLFLAFFIVICKRRHEIVLLSDDAKSHRPVLEHYSEPFLDQMVSLATAGTVISYTLYAIFGVKPGEVPRAHLMVYTVPFVLYGICRYLYLVYKKEEGGAPEILILQDWSLLVNVVLWLVFIGFIFY